MKASAYCESVNRSLHENQSSDFKVSVIDKFKNILNITEADIFNDRFETFAVSVLYSY